jgi:small subunit ribosomal protein S1
LDVNEEEGKLVVSQRRALVESAAEIKRGEVVSGTVTGLRQYGAFLELDGGMNGLLHISQISYDRIENVENVFTIGQRVKVRHDTSVSLSKLLLNAFSDTGQCMIFFFEWSR